MAHIVGLCGIDGSGKTTVARRVVQDLHGLGVRVRYHHELDFVTGKLLVRLASLILGRRQTGTIKDSLLERKEQNQPLISLLYHLLIWTDSLLTFAWFKFTPGLVVHDRWPYDFLLQFRHRGYRNRLVWALFSLFPRPDTLILLKVPASVAYERKRTDPGHLQDGPEFFEKLAGWMDEIENRSEYDGIIDGTAALEVVAQEVRTLIQARACRSEPKTAVKR